MALSTISGGIDTGFSTKLNNNFRANRILQVYSSTGLDIAEIEFGGTSTVTSSTTLELTAVAASSLGGADYLVLDLSAYTKLQILTGTGDDAEGYLSITVQTKQIGGAYSDSMSEFRVLNMTGLDMDSESDSYWHGLTNLKWHHTLTAGEKSAGVQVKIIVKIYLDNAGGIVRGQYTGKQVVLSTAV